MGDSVSIVIVNYNAGKRLLPCVRSALEQAAQVVVVDNASSDASIGEVTAAFGSDPRLLVIRNPDNVGFAAACNIGAGRATGAYVLFLNPDCVLQDGAVTRLTQALQAAPRAGMAGALLLNEDGSEQAGGRRMVPTPSRSLVRIFHLSALARRWPQLFVDFNLHRQPLPPQTVEVEAISGACTMVRRDAMLDVGPWDERYFLHCEDLDLCMRYRQKGWSVLFVPDARIVHHQGTCSRSRPVFVEWHKHRGMLRFYRKFFRDEYPGPLMWLVTLAVWARFGAIAMVSTLSRALGRIAGGGNG